MSAARQIAPANRIGLFEEIPDSWTPILFRMRQKAIDFGQLFLGVVGFVIVLLRINHPKPGSRELMAMDGVMLGGMVLMCAFWVARTLVRIWTWRSLEVDRALHRLAVVMKSPFWTRCVEIPFDGISRIALRRLEGPDLHDLSSDRWYEVRLETVEGGYMSLGTGSEEAARGLADRFSVLTHCRNEALPWRSSTP